MAVSNEATENVGKVIDRTSMPGMLNLRNVLELVDDGALAGQQLIAKAH